MTTLNYMKLQAEKARLNYELALKRPNVTQKELSDLKSKVRYYETAVAAMEKIEANKE